MCGIAGIFHTNGQPASISLLKKMTDTLIHRGPDGDGYYIDSFIGFGHRRLAILDLSPAGHQPMITADGNTVITYNGEIYNFNELRIELEELGWQFHSKTDTEVVLKAFAEWGVKALVKFNGMYAFAIWNKKKQELTLVRDRYGIKPLYYYFHKNKLLFASEVKAIISHPEFETHLDHKALLEYFTFQNFLTNRTLFSNVNLLPAGSYLTIKLSEKSIQKPTIYWDFAFNEPEIQLEEQEYIEELSRLFNQAVSRQLVSDVELGSYLSGGMDSGSITAIASSQLPFMKTFTVGFDLSSASGMELNFDERSTAEHLSYLFKTEHYEMVLKAGDMERAIPHLAKHLEEPRVGQCYPNYYAAKLASKFVKVVLSGSGGDELFGGYPWRYYRAAVNDNFEDYIDKYYAFWQRLIPNTLIRQAFQPIWHDVKDVWTRDIFRDVFAKHANVLSCPEDYINHSLYFEAKTFLHGLFLVEDKLSMAHSLETRVPFLDNDLVNFSMQLPMKLKLGKLNEVIRINENDTGNKVEKYYARTNDGKLLLRRIMEKYVPKNISQGEKQGFSAPDASWFKGESVNYVNRTLLNNKAKVYDYLDRNTIQNLVKEHINGEKNRRLLIWSLLNFEQWCHTYL